MAEIKHLAVIADTQCGSTLGMLPKGFRSLELNHIQQNPIQQQMWEHWQEFHKVILPSIVGAEPYGVVYNGDATEGTHHGTVQVITPNPKDHIKAAVDLLYPVADRASDFLMIRGTECHVGPSASYEDDVMFGLRYGIDKLRVNPDDIEPLTHWHRQVYLGDYIIDFAHHVGTSTAIVPGTTACAKLIGENLAESSKNGVRHADVIVRSHAHTFASTEVASDKGTIRATITPAWQALTSFGWKVVSGKIPRVGAIVLSLEKHGGITQRVFTWPLLRPEPLRLKSGSSKKMTSAAFSGKSSSKQAKQKRVTG